MGGISLALMVPAHLSVPLIAGRGIGSETCGVGDGFPSDDPRFDSDNILHEFYIDM